MALSRRYFKQQYFYLLDESGRLYHLTDPLAFLRHGKVPSGPSFLRNEPFLKFFFSHMHATPRDLPHAAFFPFVSRCGSEGNFVAAPAARAPVVFTEYDRERRAFSFGGGTLTQTLDPALLREHDGRLYHPLTDHRLFRGLRCDPTTGEPLHPLPVRRQFRAQSDAASQQQQGADDDDEAGQPAVKAQSECVDAVEIETVVRELAASRRISEAERAVDLALAASGLVSSSVAFEIGFNFMAEAEEESQPAQKETRQRYIISFDDGETAVDVQPLIE